MVYAIVLCLSITRQYCVEMAKPRHWSFHNRLAQRLHLSDLKMHKFKPIQKPLLIAIGLLQMVSWRTYY